MAGVTCPNLWVSWVQSQPDCLDLRPGWYQAWIVQSWQQLSELLVKLPTQEETLGSFLSGSLQGGISIILTKPTAQYPTGSGQIGMCHDTFWVIPSCLGKLYKAYLVHCIPVASHVNPVSLMPGSLLLSHLYWPCGVLPYPLITSPPNFWWLQVSNYKGA